MQLSQLDSRKGAKMMSLEGLLVAKSAAIYSNLGNPIQSVRKGEKRAFLFGFAFSFPVSRRGPGDSCERSRIRQLPNVSLAMDSTSLLFVSLF